MPGPDVLAAAKFAAACAWLESPGLAVVVAVVVVVALLPLVAAVVVVPVPVVGEEQAYEQVYGQVERRDAPLHVEDLVSAVLRGDTVGAGMDVEGVRRANTSAAACHTVENRRVDSSPMARSSSFLLAVVLLAWSCDGLCVPGDVLGDEDPDTRGSSRPVDPLQRGDLG